MHEAHDAGDFTDTTVPVPNPRSSVRKVRANRLPRGCLGASQGSTDLAGGSNRAPLARPVPLASAFLSGLKAGVSSGGFS